MRKPISPLFIKLALIGIFLSPSIAHAALFSATWVAGSAGGNSATGTMGAVNLNLTTVGVGNSTQIFPGTWQQILPSNLGTLYPDAAISIGYNCNGSAQNQSVTFSTPVTDPYLLFNYVDLGSVYNFSGFAGTVALVGNTVGATLSNNIITLATPGSYNQSSSGFAIQLPGTYSSINYTITNPSCNSGHDSAGFDVAETGFSITPTIGAHGTVTPNQVITVLPNTKASFSVTPDNGYVANMGGTCGGTFSGNTYTTSTVTQDCTVTASFVTNPQAQLNLNANPTGITVSSTSTLTTNGGSGTGAISYNVSGPCTINGNTLTGTAIGSCLVTATKGGDVTFAPATSNTVTVDVSLVQQPALLLSASNTGISIGGTSTLSTTGGSGSGVVSYYVISGLCTLNGAVVTATGAGECKLGANKAADATYASVTSNEVTIHVDLAPQATLELYADKTSILVGQNSYLSTVGGSGTGSVYYSVIDGPCTITASVLHGLAQGTCKVQATKFADLTYNQTTSNIVNVLVDLNLQQSLNLYPNPTGIAIGGISGLATSGGSGTGAVTFKVLSGPCTLSGNQLTSKAAGLCQVSASKEADGTYAKTSSNVASVYVVLAPQAALNLTASNTGIAVGSTSTLSTSGGSGTGTVAYQVLSGPCTLNGALLTGSGAGTCRVSATKAADGTYAQTSSNEESVYVVLAPQSALTLLANPTGIAIGGISGLATSGGSGSGIVTYELISGSCTLSGNQLTGKAPGLCQVLATKAADSTFAETKSNIESVYVVLAPQATLNLTASNTGIAVGSTSTLSTSGGSGTGTVAYQVLSGPCTLNGALLTGAGAGTCRVSATKAADGAYAQTSSNEVSVYVVLAPQSAFTLAANPSGIAIGGISGLATSGGSGTGAVTFKFLSGPCTLSGNQLTGKAPGLCQVSATKAADTSYAAITSNIESVYVVLAPQAALNLTASNTGIAVGSTSTLSTSGGSGTGTVAYQVLSGPCTLNGALLTGTGVGICRVSATKAADGTYAETSSNVASVYVVLAPQPILTLTANPSPLIVGGTSNLSTLGGAGSGNVTYLFLNGPCTLNNAQLIGKATGTCQVQATKSADGTYAALSSNIVSVLVSLAPQTPLNLSASNTSISIGSTSTLSTSGGSGNGAISYRVVSGPCLLNGGVLTGSGAGTCLMSASKAADGSYAATTSNSVSVLVNLIPQAGLNLTISTPSMMPGETATLTVTGGSGTGAVFYEVLSGPCTLNGNSLIGRGPGSCVVRATKAQSNGYAETTSNSVVESVTAPAPTPEPIPTLSEWEKITMMLLMFLTVGWFGQRLNR